MDDGGPTSFLEKPSFGQDETSFDQVLGIRWCSDTQDNGRPSHNELFIYDERERNLKIYCEHYLSLQDLLLQLIRHAKVLRQTPHQFLEKMRLIVLEKDVKNPRSPVSEIIQMYTDDPSEEGCAILHERLTFLFPQYYLQRFVIGYPIKNGDKCYPNRSKMPYKLMEHPQFGCLIPTTANLIPQTARRRIINAHLFFMFRKNGSLSLRAYHVLLKRRIETFPFHDEKRLRALEFFTIIDATGDITSDYGCLTESYYTSNEYRHSELKEFEEKILWHFFE